jgi:DNA-directed RNA polymerase specialized sigma24 family protein
MSELPLPLSDAEVRSEISSLTAGERTKLILIARHYAWRFRISFEDPDEFVHEAICRVLERKRVWPRGVEKLRFLAGVIKSIAGDRKRALNRESAALDELKKEEMEKEKVVGDKGAEEPVAADKIDLERIMVLFDDDPIAQKILKGMEDGARGKDLQQASGLRPTEYESKRKKIRRRIEKLIEKLKT